MSPHLAPPLAAWPAPAWRVVRRRWPVLGALLLGVALLHAGLAGPWRLPRPPLPRVLHIESRWLPAPEAPREAAVPGPLPQLAARAAPVAAPEVAGQPSAALPPQLQRAVPMPAAAAPAPPALPATALASMPGTPSVPAAAPGATGATAAPDAEAEPEPEPPATGLAQAPPLYDTRLPPSAVLRFALSRGASQGEARLLWHRDGERYLAAFDAGLDGLPLWQQRSVGQLDAHGLAPDHFSDRRRQRVPRTARFDRAAGQVVFGRPPGPSARQAAASRPAVPAWSGAQDRLGWVVQLAAIVAAAPQPPPEVTLFVVGARGGAGPWTFQRRDDVAPGSDSVDPAAVPVYYRREPERRDDQRVEVWLHPADHWPLRLRLTPLPGGAPLELRRLAGPLPVPAPQPASSPGP